MKKLEIELENLIPSNSSFELNQFPGHVFELRPCTGGMLIDMSKKIGNIEKVLSIPSAENVSKMAMMLMDYDSAVKFKAQKVKTIDVLTGKEEVTEMGGYKILMHSIQGISEQYDVYRAILESLGYAKDKSSEIIKELKSGINKIVNQDINKKEKKRAVPKKK